MAPAAVAQLRHAKRPTQLGTWNCCSALLELSALCSLRFEVKLFNYNFSDCVAVFNPANHRRRDQSIPFTLKTRMLHSTPRISYSVLKVDSLLFIAYTQVLIDVSLLCPRVLSAYDHAIQYAAQDIFVISFSCKNF